MPQPKKKCPARKSPIQVRAVDFVMYCTKDMPKTRGFYHRLFGLKKSHEWNNFWSEFNTKPLTLCLNGPSDKPKMELARRGVRRTRRG